MKKILQEFKQFAMRGNVIDMAVGIIIGGAFGKIVSSVVGDIISPIRIFARFVPTPPGMHLLYVS